MFLAATEVKPPPSILVAESKNCEGSFYPSWILGLLEVSINRGPVEARTSRDDLVFRSTGVIFGVLKA